MTPIATCIYAIHAGIWILAFTEKHPDILPDTIRIDGAPPIADGLEPCLTYLGEAARIVLCARGITDGDVPVLRDGQTLGAISLRGGEVTIGVARPTGGPE